MQYERLLWGVVSQSPTGQERLFRPLRISSE